MDALRATGRGLRDFGLFFAIGTAVFLGYTAVLSGGESLGSAALLFGPALALEGAVLSVPGLVVHRVLVRRAEPLPRSGILARSPVIAAVDAWWLAWLAVSADVPTALGIAAVVVVTSVIYGALVPRRGMPEAARPASSRGAGARRPR